MSIKVLLVDDSPTARKLLTHIVNNAEGMEVIGEATDGSQAVRLNQKLRPDVILMDITMPKMNGMEATEEIMGTQPTPIVMISANLRGREADIAFQAISLGALTVMPKPVGMGSPEYGQQAAKLVATLRNMAGVRVIHHRSRANRAPAERAPAKSAPLPMPARPLSLSSSRTVEAIAIVSSTGGPAALSEIVRRLPAEFTTPVFIVQHIAESFTESLLGWLAGLTPLRVTLAHAGQKPQPGTIYLAPGGKHLHLRRDLSFAFATQPVTSHMPSGDELLGSVAAAYGSQAIGVVLTGMGADGARGLRKMFDAGALTIAQDEATSAVYGMPKEAAALGAAQHILPLSDIPNALIQLTLGEEITR